MYIVETIPIRKGIPRDTLSYFSARPIPIGALVEIPLHSQQIEGIVVGVSPVRDMKASIRTGNFSLRPVTSIIRDLGFSKPILESLCRVSEQNLIPVGTLISTFFPEPVFDFFSTWKSLGKKNPEMRIVELSTPDRLRHYQTIIRESFAKKESIQIVAPTITECDEVVKTIIEKNDQEIVVTLHSGISPQKREGLYKKIQEHPGPLVICTTPQFFMIPRTDLGALILESSGSPSWRQEFAKNIDYRPIILNLAETLGLSRYLGDSIPSPDHSDLIERRKAYMERTSTKTPVSAEIKIAIKESYNDPGYTSPIFAQPTINELKKLISENKRVFIFSARKSIATTTSCRDCGYIVECPNCSTIMHLIRKNPLSDTDRVFHCHRCETEIPTMNHCPVCMGWNLIPLGVTIESIADEINKFFPEVPVFKSTQELTKTDAAARKVVKTWNDEGGILIGTQRIIPFLSEIPTTIIASFDHLMSIPAFDTPFTTLWLMEKLRERTTDQFIIQTKESTNTLLEQFARHEIPLAIQDDYDLRKEYHFPPCQTLVTITLDQVARNDHLSAKEFLRRPLAGIDHSIQSQFFETTHTYSITAIAHIPHDIWYGDSLERKRLVSFLASIRHYAEIDIRSKWI